MYSVFCVLDSQAPEHGLDAKALTLIDLADAIGLELDIRIRRQPAKRNGHYSPLKVHSTV
jgi:hypothetical protein